MGQVIALLGSLPVTPEVMTMGTMRALRSPEGEPPCSDGLRRASKLLDAKGEISTADLLDRLGESDSAWAARAIGSGYGYGYGYGSGYGYGYGYGYGDGSGDGYGSGSGDGSGSGYGYGYGYGDGSGYGYGSGSGYEPGDD